MKKRHIKFCDCLNFTKSHTQKPVFKWITQEEVTTCLNFVTGPQKYAKTRDFWEKGSHLVTFVLRRNSSRTPGYFVNILIRKHGEDLQLNWPVKCDTFLRNWSSFGLSAALMMAASNKPRFPQNTVLKPCPPKTWGVAICSFKSFPCLPYLGSSTRDLPFSRIFLRINMK